MIIGTCGFGATGSSVVTDYLKEYDSIQVLDKAEFTWVSSYDGLCNLDQRVNHPYGRTSDSIQAIELYRQLCKKKARTFERFGLTADVFSKSVENFLNSIIQTRWTWSNDSIPKGWLHRKIKRYANRYISRWEKKHGCRWTGFPLDEVCLSVKPENFDEAVRRHVREIMTAMCPDQTKPIALDQPFPGNNPQASMKYFEDAYAVVVDRDPRDLYTFARTRLLGRAHFMPINKVEDFVTYYRALRKGQPYTEPNERILFLRFEDMVYHYDEATAKLRDFLGLPENPNPKSIFDPAISMPNTQVWKRFPQFAKDIEYIERELPEYLFDYSGCPEPDPNGKMFFGQSPLNKTGNKDLRN